MNQPMTIEDAHQLAVYTGRVSAAAFVVALGLYLARTRAQARAGSP